MNERVVTVGNYGPKIRSDCEIILELKTSGGIVIDLNSKVSVLYGESIKNQCIEILKYFGITDAALIVNDSGALPFVIAARLEYAIKKLVKSDAEFLPEMLNENIYATGPDRFRFSRLYIPGNNPAMMINAGLHSADGIILDLEDSVSPEKKDEARILVRNALRQISFGHAERMVRINQGERGLEDLDYVVPHNVNLILIPKCETVSYIKDVEARISKIRSSLKLKNPVHLMPIIESALGVEMSFEIAKSASDIVAIAIGLEDLTADMGIPRTLQGNESFYARTRLINAAKAAGIQPIDSVFSDVSDMEALRMNVLASKALGFEGMGCIHPRQIDVINKGFAPGIEEVEKAKSIVVAFKTASLQGSSVVALGAKMIDPPVVLRAQKVVDLAVKFGILSENWINEDQNYL
jgi:citrate lyase subunit beta/citryl-CoA lyase